MLFAISPIDGRYHEKTSILAPYFSEYGLIHYRVKVEVLYFIALCDIGLPQLKGVPTEAMEKLHSLYKDFSEKDALRIKQIEKTTNHDVKAVEYFLKECFDEIGLHEYKEFIHFGLTSQDVNNTAIPMSLQEATYEVFLPLLEKLIGQIADFAKKWKKIPMLARTHGQAASPTLLGKEFQVFVERLSLQTASLRQIPYKCKFGGATGNFNAHFVAYPKIDWHRFGNDFTKKYLQLERLQYTTQIDHYDFIAAWCHNIERINTIFIDFTRDIWTYISMDYFKQKTIKGEVGSSAMPHKVNPIDFENAEGNLGVANALFAHLASKLPISRLQRDLTDSTVLRNIGVPLAHSVLSIQSIIRGLGKLTLHEAALDRDLDNNWAVVAEAIQTILRREAYPKPYEALKELTRGQTQITKETIHAFIDTLHIKEEVKKELKEISPQNYVGKMK